MKNWTSRTILRLWLIALGVQVLILLPWAVQEYRLRHPAPPAPDTRTSFADLLARMDSAERARMLRRFDSAGIAVDYRGDSIAGVTFSPEFKAQVDSALTGMLRPVSDTMLNLAPLIAVVVAVAFSPTLVAAGLTGVWLWGRRGSVGESRVADV